MMMPKEKKEIQKQDIMPLDLYIKQRKNLRKDIVEFKKNRRIALGPYATFYFESYETMLAQVQEITSVCFCGLETFGAFYIGIRSAIGGSGSEKELCILLMSKSQNHPINI